MLAPRINDGLRRQLLEPIEAIVFDKDGTLTELNSRWVTFFRSIIAATAADGGDPEAEQTLAARLGVGVDHIVVGSPAAVKTESELLTIAVDHLVERGWDPTQAVASIGVGIESATFGPLTPLGDIAGAISALAGRYRLAVATSDNRGNTIDELGQLGVAQHLTTLRCGDDNGPAKPDPEVLWSLAREWALAPRSLLFVGDSEQDRDTALAAGIGFVAVVAQPLPPEHHDYPATAARGAGAWVASIAELVELTE